MAIDQDAKGNFWMPNYAERWCIDGERMTRYWPPPGVMRRCMYRDRQGDFGLARIRPVPSGSTARRLSSLSPRPRTFDSIRPLSCLPLELRLVLLHARGAAALMHFS